MIEFADIHWIVAKGFQIVVKDKSPHIAFVEHRESVFLDRKSFRQKCPDLGQFLLEPFLGYV